MIFDEIKHGEVKILIFESFDIFGKFWKLNRKLREFFEFFWISQKLTSKLQKIFELVKQIEAEILKLHNIGDKCPKKKEEIRHP